jgi:hypothetical protein
MDDERIMIGSSHWKVELHLCDCRVLIASARLADISFVIHSSIIVVVLLTHGAPCNESPQLGCGSDRYVSRRRRKSAASADLVVSALHAPDSSRQRQLCQRLYQPSTHPTAAGSGSCVSGPS